MALNRDQHRGAFAGYMIAILLFGGLFTISSRLVPLYINHSTMSNVLEELQPETGLSGKTDAQLIELIDKRLRLNNIRDFPIHQHLEFRRRGGGTELILEYEVRVPLIHNLDVIASFNKNIELSN